MTTQNIISCNCLKLTESKCVKRFLNVLNIQLNGYKVKQMNVKAIVSKKVKYMII